MAKRRSSQTPAAPVRERAGISVRVSLDKSAHGMADEIVSPETQEDRARAYCLAQGWDVVQVEHDIDESAFRQHYSRREGLMRLLAAADAGKITKIVVFKFNRLSRRLNEFTEICRRLEDVGCGVVSVSEQVDTSTPSGRMMRNIMASFAQYQSEELSEQITETWRTIAKRGNRPPGRAPYGTILKKGALVPNPTTHPVLIAMFEQFAATESVPAVLDYLTERRIPSATGKRWTNVVIRRILTNSAYVSEISFNDERYEGTYEPIVPVELWQRVQAAFHRRSSGPQVDRIDAHLLRGRVICPQCGRPMWTQYSTRWVDKTRGRERFYWCADPATGRDGCDMPAIHAEELEAAVWELTTALVHDHAQLLQQAMEQRDQADDTWQRVDQLKRERDRIQAQVRELFELLHDQVISRTQFAEQNAFYADRLAGIDRELSEVQPPAAKRSPADLLHDLARLCGESSALAEQRAALDLLGVRVHVGQLGHGVHVDVAGMRFRLPARMIGERWFIGQEYQRLDYQGTMLTDKQVRFIQRTMWASREKQAERLGRHPLALKAIIRRLREKGLLPPANRKDAIGTTTVR